MSRIFTRKNTKIAEISKAVKKKDGKSYDGGDITRTDEGIKVNKISQLDDTVKIDNEIKLHDAAQSGEEDKALESLKKLLEKKHKSRREDQPHKAYLYYPAYYVVWRMLLFYDEAGGA